MKSHEHYEDISEEKDPQQRENKKCMDDNDQNSSYTCIKLLKKLLKMNNKNNQTISTDTHKRLEDFNMHEKESQISLTYE